jgi:plasmid stability protein
MKTITVSVPDDVYRAVRVQAAERGTSVTALVIAYLRSVPEREIELLHENASAQANARTAIREEPW